MELTNTINAAYGCRVWDHRTKPGPRVLHGYKLGWMLGVEVEVERATNMPMTLADRRMFRGWQLTRDGSLRNGGAEFVLAEPKSSTGLYNAVGSLYGWLKRYGWDPSDRCGVHVHADCTTLNFDQVWGCLLTYAMVEPVLFAACRGREHGVYCTPWFHSPKEPSDWLRAMQQQTHHHAGRIMAHMCRYSALNYAPLTGYGTIEFRMAPTWGEREDMLNWLSMISCLMFFGSRGTKAVLRDFDDMQLGAIPRKVLGPGITMIPGGEEEWEALMLDADAEHTVDLLTGRDAEGMKWTYPEIPERSSFAAFDRSSGKAHAIDFEEPTTEPTLVDELIGRADELPRHTRPYGHHLEVMATLARNRVNDE